MANYLVVKFPNNRHSFTIKEEEPPKPYLKVKNGYLSLTTETSGGGFKAKLNGINYKIVETFTTTVETTTAGIQHTALPGRDALHSLLNTSHKGNASIPSTIAAELRRRPGAPHSIRAPSGI